MRWAGRLALRIGIVLLVATALGTVAATSPPASHASLGLARGTLTVLLAIALAWARRAASRDTPTGR